MNVGFKTSGIITLTTDFGLNDPFVGITKGVILGRYADARIVDLTHGIEAYSPREAGFWLSRSFSYFPVGTVHVCVVDPGVGTARHILVVQAQGHIFLAPDNGLLTPIIEGAADACLYQFDAAQAPQLNLPVPSATFHGRDIFAPLAAALARGQCRPEDLGSPTTTWVNDPHAAPKRGPAGVEGVIVTIDRFGNLISNIDARYLQSFNNPVLHAAGQAFPLRRTYGEVEPGEYLTLVNAFEVLELARSQGSARVGLRLERGAEVVLSEAISR